MTQRLFNVTQLAQYLIVEFCEVLSGYILFFNAINQNSYVHLLPHRYLQAKKDGFIRPRPGGTTAFTRVEFPDTIYNIKINHYIYII